MSVCHIKSKLDPDDCHTRPPIVTQIGLRIQPEPQPNRVKCFTARRYATAVYAVVMCLPVC